MHLASMAAGPAVCEYITLLFDHQKKKPFYFYLHFHSGPIKYLGQWHFLTANIGSEPEP